MEIISVATQRGLVLKGAMFGNTNNDIVLVMLTGICSNVENKSTPVYLMMILVWFMKMLRVM